MHRAGDKLMLLLYSWWHASAVQCVQQMVGWLRTYGMERVWKWPVSGCERVESCCQHNMGCWLGPGTVQLPA